MFWEIIWKTGNYIQHPIDIGVCGINFGLSTSRILVDWLLSFLFYIYFSLSLHYFFLIMILFNPTSSYLWLNFLSSQGTEVTKNSISYTSVVSPQTKKKKKKDKKNKEMVWGQTSILVESFFACWRCTESHRKHAKSVVFSVLSLRSSAYHHARHVWLFVLRIFWLSMQHVEKSPWESKFVK